MSNARNTVKRLESELTAEILERSEEVHTAILALLSKKHHLQIGEPGTAKSLLVRRLMERFEGEESDLFSYLMQEFSTPDEIFGPTDVVAMTQERTFRRVPDGRLPQAKVAFLDEIWKANSSILNTLLTALNERLFNNPNPEPMPLVSMFAASNEIPVEEELNALWDRCHFRHFINRLSSSSSFTTMMSSDFTEPEKFMNFEILEAAQEEVAQVSLGEPMIELFNSIRIALKAQGIEPTDRRWKESLIIVKAEAWLNGRNHVAKVDFSPLIHVLWTDPADLRTPTRVILDLVSPIEAQVRGLSDDLYKLEQDRIKIRGEFSTTNLQEHTAGLRELKPKYISLHNDVKGLVLDAASDETYKDQEVPGLTLLEENVRNASKELIIDIKNAQAASKGKG